MICVGLAWASYIAEAIASLHRPGPGPTQDHLFATATFALAWASTCLRKELLISEIIGTSTISLVFGIPGLNLDTIYPALSTVHKALLATGLIRLLLVVGMLIDCLVCSLSYKKGSGGGAAPQRLEWPGRAHLVSDSNAAYASESAHTSESSIDDWDSEDSDDEDDEPKDFRVGQLRKSGTWVTYLHKPDLIPRKDLKLQACILCLRSLSDHGLLSERPSSSPAWDLLLTSSSQESCHFRTWAFTSP